MSNIIRTMALFFITIGVVMGGSPHLARAQSFGISQIGCVGGAYTLWETEGLRSGTYNVSSCSKVWLYALAWDVELGYYTTGYIYSNFSSIFTQWESYFDEAWGDHQLCYPTTPCTSWYDTHEGGLS
jgi:hypothetical protein